MPFRPFTLSRLILALLRLLCLTASLRAVAAPPLIEQPELTLAVGGKALLYYLPLTIAEQLGYFTEAGLKVQIVDFPGGAKSLQALIGGSADFAVGSFEHVVHMQARGQAVEAIVLLARYPALVLALRPDFAAQYHSPADLRHHRVGISAPGSSTQLFLNNLLAGAGVAVEDVPVIGVGGGAGAVAAMRQGAVDAIVQADPVIQQLESTKDAVVVLDTRTLAGAQAVYGGAYHAACLYAKKSFLDSHPGTATAIAGAQIRALRWLAQASLAQITAVVPVPYHGADPAGYRAALSKHRETWSPDGMVDVAGAQRVAQTLAASEPFVRDAHLKPEKLMNNHFGDAARIAP